MESVQLGELGHISNKLDSSSEGRLMRPGIDHPAAHQIPMQNLQMGLTGSGPSDNMAQQLPGPNCGAAKLESVLDNHIPQKMTMSDVHLKGQEQFASYGNHSGEMESMSNSSQASTMVKRKASDTESQKLLIPNKRLARVEHRPWLQQVSPSSKSPSDSQSFSNATGSPRLQASPKRTQSVIGPQQPQAPPKRSGPSKTGTELAGLQKNRAGENITSPKVRNQSFDSVRSKLRESLASALALALDLAVQNKDNTSDACVGKNCKSEAADNSQQMQEKSQSPEQHSLIANAYNYMSGKAKEGVPARNEKWGDGQSVPQEVLNSSGNSAPALKSDGKEFQSIITLSEDDVSFSDGFFVKDELLQGNGLAWVLEPDVGLKDKEHVDSTEELPNQEDGRGHGEVQVLQSPEVLASKIEEELFKLFGGVNKKYKEKGRSLLFNLKDRNNPELGERVISGEIPPKQLCSMTAEELASKELSEWRLAKAEELAQMVVLPDTQVDIRRLVRKTHKGEFQVEVEEPDAMDVAVGTSVVMNEKAHTDDAKAKSEELKASEPSEVEVNKEKVNAADKKTNLVSQDTSYTLTIPSNDGTDLMQGLMVDDELKDAEFLPPIVSLDEFMESLNSEPPFEHLPEDNKGITPILDRDNKEVEGESKSLVLPPVALVDTFADKPDVVGLTKEKADADAKPIDIHVKSIVRPLGELKGERVWDGFLQLNISALAPVIGFFRSGEKTSAKDWPGLIEVKGRVRLDAFGKFLQELPMSRSRAVMVLHFVCKDVLAEIERASVSEVAESYVSDGRVGFAEPAPGVELYVCPPHGKTCEMLGNVLPNDRVDSLNNIDNGLIGVVVWRKVTIISPKSTTDHKHNSKKQHATSRRHQEKDSKVNVNITSNPPSSCGAPPVNFKSQIPPDEDDDDDVPPGFGPPATRDEDDLPEFNFTNGSNIPRSQFSGQNSYPGLAMPKRDSESQYASRPVDEIRQLIHKYGQTENRMPSSNWQERRGLGVAVQPWNDDDDDDMPEWRPEPQLQQPQVQQPILRTHLVHPSAQQQMLPALPLQNGTWTPAGSHSLPVHHPNVGQFYGVPPGHVVTHPSTHWRRDAPESKGF